MSFLRILIALVVVAFVVAAYREFTRKKPVIEKEEGLEKAVLESEVLSIKETIAHQASLNTTGIAVRYQDGGTGHVFGKARFALPNDEPTMIHLHKDFRSNQAVTYKLIKTVTEESLNLTAGLMTSEEAYAVKRGIFTQWAEQQVGSGKFVTEIKQVTQKEISTGESVEKNIPVIKYGTNGLPVQLRSDFKFYGLTISWSNPRFGNSEILSF